MRILITGGGGFLGHDVVDHFMKNTDAEVVVLDKLTYASGGFDRLRDSNVFDDRRVTALAADFREPLPPGVCREIGDVDYILHLGGETHVNRSIEDCTPFTLSNVLGTQRMLDFARTLPNLKLMLYASTDEVYGSAPDGVLYKETDRHDPRNPYAASKAAAEMICLAYAHTYGVPVAITNTMNLMGERQHPEKYCPLVIRKVLAGETVLIHSSPDKTRAGSRFYLHCRNWAGAAEFLMEHAVPRECYNVVGEEEVDNLTLARFIAEVLGRPLKHEMIDFHSSRPGHDLRYSLDGSKLAEMGWTPPVGFWESLRRTIQWYRDNPRWLEWGQ
jgi:dTDP-glucose 4,6-dehydratase